MLRLPFQGSLIYKDHTAQQDEPFIAVLLQSRAIIVGKTNMPDFGAGANTFSEYVRANTRRMYTLLYTQCTQHSATAACTAMPFAFEGGSACGAASPAQQGAMQQHHPFQCQAHEMTVVSCSPCIVLYASITSM